MPPGLTQTPKILGQGFSVMLWGHIRFCGMVCFINFIWGLFDLKLKFIVPFLRVKNDLTEAPPPLLVHGFPKHIESKFLDKCFVQRRARV
jgi:polyferredoxin